jgi:quinoprotein glucose dehydrogenase
MNNHNLYCASITRLTRKTSSLYKRSCTLLCSILLFTITATNAQMGIAPLAGGGQGNDKAGMKYADLAQINAQNFGQLKVAWTWESPDAKITLKDPKLKTWVWESTPVMVDGILYITTSMSQVAAIDASNGQTIWTYDPETWKNGLPSNNGFVHRGITYWADGNDKRLILGTNTLSFMSL